MNTAQFRGTFASQYAQACQPWKKGGGFRLMDFYTVVQDVTPGHVPAIPGPDEFCVFDHAKKQIAFFEWPARMDSDKVHGMVEGHFGYPAVRVFDRFWVV